VKGRLLGLLWKIHLVTRCARYILLHAALRDEGSAGQDSGGLPGGDAACAVAYAAWEYVPRALTVNAVWSLVAVGSIVYVWSIVYWFRVLLRPGRGSETFGELYKCLEDGGCVPKGAI